MSSPVSAPIVPSEIGHFFTTLYGKPPKVTQDKRITTYSIPRKVISIIADQYGGLHVDVKKIFSSNKGSVGKALQPLFSVLKKKKASQRKFDSFWVDFSFPARPGSVLPSSFVVGVPGKGEVIQDLQQRKLCFWQWLNPNKECTIPRGPTYGMGATALLADKKALLVVNQSRNRNDWNLPGGGFDPNLDKAPCDAALREAQEEGGFTIEPERIPAPILLGQMRFPLNQFAPSINQTWGYFIDGISKKKLTPPQEEIKCAEWVPFSQILKKDTYKGFKIGPEIKSSLKAAINGLGFRQLVGTEKMVLHAPVPRRER